MTAKSFSTRQVVARQSAGAILNISVSFQAHEDEADVQLATFPAGMPVSRRSEPRRLLVG